MTSTRTGGTFFIPIEPIKKRRGRLQSNERHELHQGNAKTICNASLIQRQNRTPLSEVSKNTGEQTWYGARQSDMLKLKVSWLKDQLESKDGKVDLLKAMLREQTPGDKIDIERIISEKVQQSVEAAMKYMNAHFTHKESVVNDLQATVSLRDDELVALREELRQRAIDFECLRDRQKQSDQDTIDLREELKSMRLEQLKYEVSVQKFHKDISVLQADLQAKTGEIDELRRTFLTQEFDRDEDESVSENIVCKMNAFAREFRESIVRQSEEFSIEINSHFSSIKSAAVNAQRLEDLERTVVALQVLQREASTESEKNRCKIAALSDSNTPRESFALTANFVDVEQSVKSSINTMHKKSEPGEIDRGVLSPDLSDATQHWNRVSRFHELLAL